MLAHNASSSIPDLSMFAQRQASVVSNYMDTSQLLANQCHPYMDYACHSLSPGPPPGASCLSDHSSLLTRPLLDPRISRFTANRFLPFGPPPEASSFTDQDPYASGPLTKMPDVTDNFFGPLQSGSSSGVSSLSSIESEGK